MSDSAITVIVAGCVQVAVLIVGFLTLWVKLRYGTEQAERAAVKAQIVEKKIDNNTILTVKGTAAAAETAAEVKATLDKKLNGGLDAALKEAVTPVKEALESHMAKDAEDMAEIKDKLSEHVEYTHKRHHDILDAVGVLSNKLTALILKSEK